MAKQIIQYQSNNGQLFDSFEAAEWNDLMEEYCDEIIHRSIFKAEQIYQFKSIVKQLTLYTDLFEKYAPKLIKLKKKINEQNTTT